MAILGLNILRNIFNSSGHPNNVRKEMDESHDWSSPSGSASQICIAGVLLKHPWVRVACQNSLLVSESAQTSKSNPQGRRGGSAATKQARHASDARVKQNLKILDFDLVQFINTSPIN